MEKSNLSIRAKKLTLFAFLMILVFWLSYLWGTGEVVTDAETQMRAFTLILWSILLEALPFVMLGTIISSLIQVFVSEETILKVLPKNNILRLVFSACVGFIFPVCECAIIPITRGLIKKGMPKGAAITFMIATPIVNPVVLLSTYNAFPNMPEMVIYRAAFGFIGAIVIGFIVGLKQEQVLKENAAPASCCCAHHDCGCGHDHDEHEHDHSHEHTHEHEHSHEHEHGHEHENHNTGEKRKLGPILKEIISHTNHEVKSVGGYLILGAFIAASMQMFVPKDILVSLGTGRISSTLVMMVLAFVLSLCSEADAFIASTFMLRFASASVLTFMILGPMIDIKNTLMMFGSFKKKFALKVILVILVVCFVLGIIASFIMGDSYA